MQTKVIIQSYSSISFVLISTAFLIVGVALVFSGVYLGIIPVIVSFAGYFYNDGTEIDFRNKKVREFFAIGPIRFGDWAKIHHSNEFQLRSVRMIYTRRMVTLESSYHNQELKLMLKIWNGKFLMIKRSENREQLLALEQEIKTQLDL